VTENEKLRALLAEARVLCDYNVDAQGRRELRVRIDAALAEPVGVGMDPPTYACLDCGHCMHGITFAWQDGERPRSMCLKCRRNRVDAIELVIEKLVRERDEARASHD
jgi:heterodisulfide reductase subunit C